MSKLTKRGVSLPLIKEPAASRPIVDITPPTQVAVPLVIGDGNVCRPAVKTYETVLQGDLLGIPENSQGSPILSPISGVLADIHEIQHPLLGSVNCAVIDCMVAGSFGIRHKEHDKTSDSVIMLSRELGIVDESDGILLYKKLSDWAKIDPIHIVADASEQEPYCSSAWSVLNQSAAEVEKGLELAALACNTPNYHIAAMLSKKHRDKLESVLKKARLFSVRGKYPADIADYSEHRTVCRIGVQACLALYHGFADNRPPWSMVITVAGDAVANPKNVRVPIGTSVDDILHFCGLSSQPKYIILGDALTGIAINRTNLPVITGITCILALKEGPRPPVHACIGCGRCVSACHAGLLPYEIMRRLDNMQYERLASLLPQECDGCGACSYVCPCGLDVTAKVSEALDAQGNIFIDWGDRDDI